MLELEFMNCSVYSVIGDRYNYLILLTDLYL